MEVIICYVCNEEPFDWRRNFVELKSEHTNTPICEFIKRFLGKFQSIRSIDTEMNCICVECLRQINEFDRICKRASDQENELRNLLLSTESLISAKSYEVEVETESENEITFEPSELGLDIKEESDNEIENCKKTQSKSTANNQSIQRDVTSVPLEKQLVIRKDGKLMRFRLTNRIDNKYSNLPKGTFIKSSDGKIVRVLNSHTKIEIDDSPPAPIVKDIDNDAKSAAANQNSELKRKSMYPKKCEFCDEISYDRFDTREHFNKHNKCDECGIILKRPRFLLSHKKWHERHPGFTCRHCYFVFGDADSLRDHRKLHSSKPEYECLFCGKQFKNILSLRIHVATHAERNLLCELCGKSFVTKNLLLSHINTHTNERMWKCPICSKVFNSSGNKRLHLACHTDDRPYTCSFCAMKFKRIDHCRKHERRHTQETKLEKCHICSAAFEHKFHLKQHIERRHRIDERYAKRTTSKNTK